MGTRKNRADLILELEHDLLIDKREIWLANKHPDEYDINSHTATQFVKNLRLLDSINNEPIKIHLLASDGGNVDSGLTIFNAISSSKSHITMIVYSGASSISSTILQAADIRLLYKHSYLMLHYMSIAVESGWVATKSLMERINKEQEILLNIYIDRAKNGDYFKDWKESKIRKFIKDKLSAKEDWYVNTDEAVMMGLADGIIGETGFESV